MTARSRITTVLVVAMLVVSMVAAAPAAGVEEDQEQPSEGDLEVTEDQVRSPVQALEDGEDLYLVFGADLNGTSIEEYVEAHASSDGIVATSSSQENVNRQEGEASSAGASADVVQYQDVDQVNINVQDNATAISIDGGEAKAIQEATQSNVNQQTGEASAANVALDPQEFNFENVGNVYLVMGEGSAPTFDGWVVADKKGKAVSQKAWASVAQGQDAGQLNYNEQSVSLAIAENGSNATTFQQTTQYNENRQEGAANASNVYAGYAKASDQVSADAASGVYQDQDVEQTNVNEQSYAVAIAIGENSTATAVQLTEQTNVNLQYGTAEAVNVLSAMAGMNTATAGGDDSPITTFGEEGDSGNDEKKQKKKEKGHDVDGGEQVAEAQVAQYQNVTQVNVNLQNSAIAIATNGSDATAVQISYQENINTQIGYSEAVNAYLGGGYAQEGLVYTDQTAVTIDGNDGTGDQLVSFDYDTNSEQTQEVDQNVSAVVEQVQFIRQQNLNEQSAAIAVADDGGNAGAAQVSMQANENVQFASAQAANFQVC